MIFSFNERLHDADAMCSIILKSIRGFAVFSVPSMSPIGHSNVLIFINVHDMLYITV